MFNLMVANPQSQMACMTLGSKSEVFHREGKTWLCSTGLPSDVMIEIGEMSFNVHKFPLLSRSGLLEKLIEEFPTEDGSGSVLKLQDLPGGAKAFELITKFCYGIKIELTPSNIVSLRCAAEYLRMTEDYGEGNLIAHTEAFLNEVFSNWTDSIKALETCEEFLQYAEELHIVSRCIESLATKACTDPHLFNWSVSECSDTQTASAPALWNGLSGATKPPSTTNDWWFEDVSFLRLPLYKRLILAIESRGMQPETIAASLLYYAKRRLPLMNMQATYDVNHINPGTTISTPSEADQKVLLEDIVGLLPVKKGATSTNFLLRLLRAAMVLHASPSCRENLEKRVGAQLDQAVLVDLLIPNMGYSVDTLYDIECVHRILDHFKTVELGGAISSSPCIVEDQLTNGTDPLTPITMVANLIDEYLAEVAPDVNLKPPKFEALAAVVPDYARRLDDGIYHAVDVYLKAHPWLTDMEREQLCRLMNCQKLSLEASTHAAQNERLPLRVIVQVLFFEQMRLRTSISGWFFVSENLETSQNPDGSIGLPRNDESNKMDNAQDCAVAFDIAERVSDLEKECLSMNQELRKLAKSKRSWKIFSKKLGFGQKSRHCNVKETKSCDMKTTASSLNGKQGHHNNAEVLC
ncbi:BTB/POZ domain-containing protein At5g03250-like isoform X2 [Tripterygium wilfordii]|uniref:BTB/POZ domain-containing protein At5g03250-like isoform X2 n=1 Tax=Tripterygium wilfordii TaxID=458696 RepID=UPI0018F832C4|nr:BTB/POZ domain-containing protein At5g03250-like isoform X2 [Tripterygium wilfordii]